VPIDDVLGMAGDNRGELESVLQHYKADSQKQKYARFLIANMPGHASFEGDAVNTYRKMIDTISGTVRISDINKEWERLTQNTAFGNGNVANDIQKISAKYLIDNIDHASHITQSRLWSKSIDEDLFCKYILPYRVTDEPISDYRETLYQAYQPLIDSITDLNKAFSSVYHYVLKHFSLTTPKYSYTPDALTLHELQAGTCAHRCVYLVCVLRSLGIPATYDYIAAWGNYSQGGHTWVSLVGPEEKTYSIFEKDTLAKQFNLIDGFALQGAGFLNEYPDTVSQRVYLFKTVSTIYRHTYFIPWEDRDIWLSDERPPFFKNIHALNVSGDYGLSGTIEADVSTAAEYAFLYAFASVRNWQPTAFARVKRHRARFEHLGDSVVYLPVIYKDEKHYEPIGYPVLLQSDSQRTLKPDTTQLRTVVVKRKYPLFCQWVKRGNSMVGGRFEGSQTPDFRHPILLHSIASIPLNVIKVDIDVPEVVRYVRYLPPGNTRLSIAETAYFTKDEQGNEQLLQGAPIGERIEKEYIEKAFDRKYSTYTETPLEYFWFGLDLGKKQRVTRIEYCPLNDGNLVEPGTEYELFYWDNQWQSMGRKTAAADSLNYDNVPESALLWLKCHAGGREERIFTYENGEQVWW
jgi:hypothetical protein